MKSSGKSFQTILVAFIALALVSGIFVASNATTTAMDNVVVCVNKKTGTMRLPMKDKCKKKEQKIVLARTGPQGIQGIQGAIGPAGPVGPIGSGGNYLNSQFAVYDSNEKLVPFEILSFDYGATVQFKGFNFRIDGIQYANDEPFPYSIYKDNLCRKPFANFGGDGFRTNLFPSVRLSSTKINFWLTANARNRLFSWSNISKYGETYLKVEFVEVRKVTLERFKRESAKILRAADSSLTDSIINSITDKIKLTYLKYSADSSGGDCIELGDYLDLVASLKKHSGISDIYRSLLYGSRKDRWLGQAINFEYLQESDQITDLALIFQWDELTSYLEEYRADTYIGLMRAMERFERIHRNAQTYELTLWREFNFPFAFPLEIKKRK